MGLEDRYEPLLARRIPRDDVTIGRAYVIHARNGGVGVAVDEAGSLGYQLHREKLGYHYLFVEYDWDEDPPHGTAIPLATIDAEPPKDEAALLHGTAVPSNQVTDQDSAEVRGDIEHLATMIPTSLDALLRILYTASSHSDRSRIAPALDRLLAYLDHYSTSSPERIAALFERLDPSRLVRAVGQTLLASTRLDRGRSVARQEFLSRFLGDLRIRGTPEAVIARLQKGLET